MKFRNLVAAAAALTLSSPVLAADVSRAAAPVADASMFGGDGTILLLLAVILMGVGIFILANNDDDTPASP